MAQAENKTVLAKKLGVSRQSLYYRPKKPKEDTEIKEKIMALREEHPAYGHRRMALFLGMNRKRIHRIMKKFDIKPKIMRGKPWKPGDVGKPATAIPNLAKQVCPIRANVLWAGDFTYIPWRGDFIYVATVIDAVERVGKVPKIFHSDQGSEYVSGQHELLLANLSVAASQSKKSSPLENGFQESFYNQWKLELGKSTRFHDLGELVEAIHAQMRYYNHERIHSVIKMPPATYRIQHENKTTALLAV